MISEKLAKIKKVTFGIGGYQDAMIGFNFVLGNKDWDVQDFKSLGWVNVQIPKKFETGALFDVCVLLSKSGANNLDDLIGKPVLCFFDGDRLTRWRILDEVL